MRGSRMVLPCKTGALVLVRESGAAPEPPKRGRWWEGSEGEVRVKGRQMGPGHPPMQSSCTGFR